LFGAGQTEGELPGIADRPTVLVESVAGITEAAPSGEILTGSVWTVIAAVILRRGKVVKVPCHGLTAEQHVALDAAAEAVWLHGRDVLTGWQHHSKLGWFTDIRIATPHP
jgi:hypothetical protein